MAGTLQTHKKNHNEKVKMNSENIHIAKRLTTIRDIALFTTES